MSQQIHFLKGKARGEAKRKKLYFQLLRRVRRLRKRLLRDLESVWRNFEGRADLPSSRRLKGQEALCLIAEDLAALEQAANVCERRVMEQEKVPVADKIISLSDADASFIVKGGWNTVVGYRPQLARSGGGFVTALVLPRGNAADSPHFVTMVKEQITNTGVIPSMASADDGYSTQQGRGSDRGSYRSGGSCRRMQPSGADRRAANPNWTWRPNWARSGPLTLRKKTCDR